MNAAWAFVAIGLISSLTIGLAITGGVVSTSLLLGTMAIGVLIGIARRVTR